MLPLDSQLVRRALAELGSELGPGTTVRLAIVGGTAGMLTGLLPPARTTADCDVIWGAGEPEWTAVARAAERVAGRLGLPGGWLNRECETWAWCLPLGWRSRTERAGAFGRLEVVVLSRGDLIAAKVMGAPSRPQDLRDLREMKPTPGELDAVSDHLDRLASEDLDGRTFDDQHRVLEALRGRSET